MASTIAFGLFNSLSFAKLNHSGYVAEIKRHDKAMEDLSKGKAWYENEIYQKDRIQQLREELSDANVDINQTNKALDELRKIQTVEYNGLTFLRNLQAFRLLQT